MKNARPSSLKPRSFVAGVAIVAMALVVVFLPSSVAVAQQGGTGGLGNGGVLQLHLGSSGAAPQDYFGFRDSSGAGFAGTISQKQSIAVQSGCKLTLTPSNSLVTLSPTPSNASVGFVSDSIGIRTNSEGNGQPCGQINVPGQALTLNLAKSGKMIDYAELDIELKFNGAFSIQGYIGNSAVGSAQTYTSVGSDSGPDSGDNDNYRIRFPRTGFTLVNKLVLTPTSGAASLEGGADGTQACDTTDAGECGGSGFSLGQTLGTTDSLFHLVNVDGVLGCGDSATQSGGAGTPTNVLDREDNVGGADCTPIPYNLESGDGVTPGCTPGSPQCILLQKDLLDQNAQFTWTVTWAPETTQYPESATEFDFDLDGDFQALQPCLADNDGDGLPQLPPTLDQNDPASAVDPWCIENFSSDFDASTGLWALTETYFGGGDPGGKRG